MSLFSLLNFFANILIYFLIPIFIFEYYNRDPTTQFIPMISYSIIIIVVLIWIFGPEEGKDNNNERNDNDKTYYFKNNYYNNDKTNKQTNFFKNDKNKYKKYDSLKNKYYCSQMDINSYDKITELNTNLQLNKLQKSKEFQKMYEEKGDNMNNWNWQSRERLQNKAQRDESDIGSDEIENLSLSD